MPAQQFANNSQSTLGGSITNVATSLTVASASTFPPQGEFPIVVDNEIMRVTGVSGTTFTVVRGQEGTAAAAHTAGAAVSGALTARSLLGLYWYDVRAYGAKGDGTTDDSTAFGLARDAAGSGGSVFVPPGTYILNGFDWNVSSQSWLVRGTLKAKASASAGFTVSGARVLLDGGTIDGNLSNNATQSTGLTVTGATSTVRGLRVTNTRGTGVSANGANVEIDDCEIDAGNGTGVSIGTVDLATVRGCYVHDLTTGLAVVSGATNARVIDNRFASVTTQFTDAGTGSLFLGNLPQTKAIRTNHVGLTSPSGGASGDLAVGTGTLWANDNGTWKSITLIGPSSTNTVVTVGRTQKGQVISANNTIIDGVTFQGPGADQYGSAYGVYGVGAYTGCIIRNCTFKDFDHTAIWLEGLIDPLIEDCVINDVTYTGIMLIGVTKGAGAGPIVRRNSVNRVGYQAAGNGTGSPDYNAYGIAVTMTVGGTASADFQVTDNTVDGVPLWHGIDTHGGLRGLIRHNTVRHCARGIFITSQATAERATSCVISYNLVTDPLSGVPTAGGTDSNTAITTYDTRLCTIDRNAVGSAYSNITNDTGGLSTGLTVTNNIRGETLPVYP